VQYDDDLSPLEAIHSGVPQNSILLYFNDVEETATFESHFIRWWPV